MPYRVKITHPNFREPFYWPGVGEEPIDMSRDAAKAVVADCERLDRSLAQYSRERGEEWKPRRFEVDWIKVGRPVLRVA